MNKKILPFAVAGILAGAMGAAQAGGVTLYGKVLVSFDALDCDVGMFTGGGCNRGGTSTTNGDDFLMNSRPGFGAVGVKGSEDLGNGLTAMFQLEYGTDPSEAAGFTGRDQWLGMKGGFGALRFGAMSTNYKMSGAKLDPMWRTSLDSRDAVRLSGLHAGAGENGQGRARNTVRYDSPSFSGAKVVANYTLDSGADGNDGYGIGLHYDQGPLFAAIDYITNDNGGEDDAWKLGGKYTMGDGAFYGHYERGGLLFADLNAGMAGNGDDSADMWHLGASYTLGSTMAYFAYGAGDRSLGNANDEHVSWTLAVKHGFSKRTSAYGGFERLDRDADGERDLFTLGMVHNF
jgi:predicted porin